MSAGSGAPRARPRKMCRGGARESLMADEQVLAAAPVEAAGTTHGPSKERLSGSVASSGKNRFFRQQFIRGHRRAPGMSDDVHQNQRTLCWGSQLAHGFMLASTTPKFQPHMTLSSLSISKIHLYHTILSSTHSPGQKFSSIPLPQFQLNFSNF